MRPIISTDERIGRLSLSGIWLELIVYTMQILTKYVVFCYLNFDFIRYTICSVITDLDSTKM